MSATATINLSAAVSYSKASGFATYSGSPKIEQAVTYTAADVSKVYTPSGTLSGATTFDLTAAVDAFGASLAFAAVKGFVIANTSATASLVVGGGTDPLFGSDQYTVKAGNTLAVTSPFTVDGTHNNLLVTPSAPCTYQAVVIGN